MNKYTLKFHNLELENSYLEYYNKQQVEHMKDVYKINHPMLILLGIICALKQDHVPFAVSVAIFFYNIGFQKYIAIIDQRTVAMLYEAQVLAIPITVLIFIYFSNHQQELGIAMIVSIMIQVQIWVTTPNIILATAQLLNCFVGVIFIIYIAFGWSLYILIWIPLFIFSIYNYYNQKRTQKLQFQTSQVNQSIFTLIKETSSDDIIYFKLNREMLEYELEFTNIKNLDLSTFLSSIFIDSKQNLKDYLFSKIDRNSSTSDNIKVIGYKKFKERVQLEIYIQYYPELKFYVRKIKKDDPKTIYPEEESKIMHLFYKKLIQGVQVKPQRINLQYIIKMLCSLNAKIQLERIRQAPHRFQQQIQQFNIIGVVLSCCNNLNIKLNYKHHQSRSFSITSDLIIFQTLIYYLLKLIQWKNHSVFIKIQKDTKIIMIQCSFHNKIQIETLNNTLYYKNIVFLQNLLSRQPISINESQLICFIDLDEEVSFK